MLSLEMISAPTTTVKRRSLLRLSLRLVQVCVAWWTREQQVLVYHRYSLFIQSKAYVSVETVMLL